MFTALLVLVTAGCDRSGLPLRPVVNADIPYLDDLGELTVVPATEWGIYEPVYNNDGELSSCTSSFNGRDNDKVIYSSLSTPPDPSIIGGAVAEFRGTGGKVCVVVDPEAVSWQQDISLNSTNKDRIYADRITDDADIDIAVGLSAYYTGSPGVSMGDFLATYTDEVGGVHELPFQECRPADTDYHAGRGIAEYCTIDTAEREGVSYTIQLKNFAVPIDDSISSYAVGVFDGDCATVITDALLDSENPENNHCGIAYGLNPECGLEGEGLKEGDDSFLDLEAAYCSPRATDLRNYCEEHLDDENPPCTLGYFEDHPAPNSEEEEEE